MYQSSCATAGGADTALPIANQRFQSSEVKPAWSRWYSIFHVTRLAVVYEAPTAISFLSDLPGDGVGSSGASVGRVSVVRPKSNASAIRSRRFATDSSR